LVEIYNSDTQKKKIITCENEQKAKNFVSIFNLVAAFTIYDDAQERKVKDGHAGDEESVSAFRTLLSPTLKSDRKFIE
jgi:hypothetical protein